MNHDDDAEKESLERAHALGMAGAATALNLKLPGFGLLVPLVEHFRKALTARSQQKEERFTAEVARGTLSEEELAERIAKLKAVPEFVDLLAAMAADIDVEKSEVYGCAAVRLAYGDVPASFARDFIFAVQQLRLEDLVFLFEVHVKENVDPDHKVTKIESARHPAIVKRLVATGCLEERIGGTRLSDFGKKMLDWLHVSLPLPAPHQNQGRQPRPTPAS